MPTIEQWQSLELSGDPTFVIARRDGDLYEARVLDLDQSAFASMYEIAESALDVIRDGQERPFAQNGVLERNEEFSLIDINDIPDANRLENDMGDDLAALLDCFANVPQIEVLDPEDFDELDQYTLYAIVYRVGAQTIIFVRKLRPFQPLRRKKFLFRRYGSTIRAVDPPDVALDDSVDIAIYDGEVAVFNMAGFDQLFFDVRIAMRDVATHATNVQHALVGKIPIEVIARDAIADFCLSRSSYAKRLQSLPTRIDAANLNPTNVKRALQAHGIPVRGLLNRANRFDFGPEQVPIFLDLIEGRYFRDDFTTEQRRADRFSPRT